MSEARIIKRNANRKLYYNQHSRYVTLDHIAEMIRGGDDVKIVDNKTKEDLTSVTLAQIIFEEEKRQKSFLPLQAMRNIIQSGGESISQLVNQAKGRVSQILRRKKDEDRHEEEGAGEAAAAASEPEPLGDEEEDGGDGAGGPNGPNGTDEATGGSRVREGLRNLREFREFLTSSQKAIDEWQRKVDGRIRHMFEGMSPFSTLQKDIGALSSRIAQLEAKLSQLVHDEHARDE